ncbi:unnamed protein product [Paramecium sonneborni]|uniref:Uncharacterized protein n=1 Tax=Paramecium sonneborni TaxID=65129 RepID=A0A8S1NM18_9CILI|nr:unnamed protein product [Paramecium sonneborni]
MNPNASRLKFQPVIALNKRTFDLDLFELEKINFQNKMDKKISQTNDSSLEIRTPTFNKRKVKLVGIQQGDSKFVKQVFRSFPKKQNRSKTNDRNDLSSLHNTQQTTNQ